MEVEAGGRTRTKGRGACDKMGDTQWSFVCVGGPTFSPKQNIRNKLTFQFSDSNFHQQIPECEN